MAAHDYRIASVEPWHVESVAARLRLDDRREIEAVSGRNPAGALADSVTCSLHAFAGLVDGVPACLFGVGAESLATGRGSIWMMGTPALEAHKRAFLRWSRVVVAAFRTLYPVMGNFVDCRNTLSIAWLKWLGFRFEPPAPYGRLGLPFMRFSMGEAENV